MENNMKTRAFLIILVGLIVVVLNAHADDYSFKYGMGIIDEAITGEAKIFSLRQEEHAFAMIYSAKEIGLWSDQGSGAGRKSSAFGAFQLGVKPGASTGIYGKAFWGVTLISSKDALLGGNAQFVSDFGVGIRDSGSFIGVGYKHISSAGIFLPNKGRDFINLELGVSF